MTKTKHDIDMFPGAVAACALPMILGLGGSLFEIFSGGRADWLATLPLSFCFLFGTPIAAWLACRYLRKAENPADMPSWGACFGAGVLGASAVHLFAALFHIMLFGLSSAVQPTDLISILFFGSLVQFGLWVSVTLPFTLLCASIFWGVTKRQT